jgi:hypothetical protein
MVGIKAQPDAGGDGGEEERDVVSKREVVPEDKRASESCCTVLHEGCRCYIRPEDIIIAESDGQLSL